MYGLDFTRNSLVPSNDHLDNNVPRGHWKVPVEQERGYRIHYYEIINFQLGMIYSLNGVLYSVATVLRRVTPLQLLPIAFSFACLVSYLLHSIAILVVFLVVIMATLPCVVISMSDEPNKEKAKLLSLISSLVVIFIITVAVLHYIMLIVPPISEKFSFERLYYEMANHENMTYGVSLIGLTLFAAVELVLLFINFPRDQVENTINLPNPELDALRLELEPYLNRPIKNFRFADPVISVVHILEELGIDEQEMGSEMLNSEVLGAKQPDTEELGTDEVGTSEIVAEQLDANKLDTEDPETAHPGAEESISTIDELGVKNTGTEDIRTDVFYMVVLRSKQSDTEELGADMPETGEIVAKQLDVNKLDTEDLEAADPVAEESISTSDDLRAKKTGPEFMGTEISDMEVLRSKQSNTEELETAEPGADEIMAEQLDVEKQDTENTEAAEPEAEQSASTYIG